MTSGGVLSWRLIITGALVLALQPGVSRGGGGLAQKRRTDEIEQLIAQLYETQYNGPGIQTFSPTSWRLRFTEPMEALLKIGPSAQQALLPRLADPAIKDQVMMILGGLADERAIGPIVEAMIPAAEAANVPNSKQVNLCGALALTNITQAEVSFGRSGGTLFLPCPNTPRECWAKWWEENSATFVARKTRRSRAYDAHTDFGIYIVR
jgi:hypothetical protein